MILKGKCAKCAPKLNNLRVIVMVKGLDFLPSTVRLLAENQPHDISPRVGGTVTQTP